MSRLSELLKSKSTPANLDPPSAGNSQESQDLQRWKVKPQLSADFEQRYRAMCRRWRYEPEGVIEGLQVARKDPAKAWLALLADERRTDEERAKWMDA